MRLRLENGKPVISKEKCNECGECIAACPVQAVAGIFPNRTIIDNKLVVTSDHKPTVKELLVLHKKGVRELISEDGSIIEQWRPIMIEANAILTQMDKEPFTYHD